MKVYRDPPPLPQKHERKAEDAIDAIVDETVGTSVDKLVSLEHIAAYAIARHRDLINDGQVSCFDLIDRAVNDTYPPVTDRTRRRRAKRAKQAAATEATP